MRNEMHVCGNGWEPLRRRRFMGDGGALLYAVPTLLMFLVCVSGFLVPLCFPSPLPPPPGCLQTSQRVGAPDCALCLGLVLVCLVALTCRDSVETTQILYCP